MPKIATIGQDHNVAVQNACLLSMRKSPNIKISLKDIAGLVHNAFLKTGRMEIAQMYFPLHFSTKTAMYFVTQIIVPR